MNLLSRVCTTVLVLVVMMAFTRPLAARQDDTLTEERRLLEDFIHTMRLAKLSFALGYAEQLEATGISDADLAMLVDEDSIHRERFDKAVERASRISRRDEMDPDIARIIPDLQARVRELAGRVEMGRHDLARDEKRIREAIKDLVGPLRAKRLAQGRLAAAGEYAVPELLRVMVGDSEVLQDPDMQRREQALKREVETVLLDHIGRQAVTPMAVSMSVLDATNQLNACNLLGRIGYPHSAPYLLELANSETASEAVRKAARRAFTQVGGVGDSVAGAFTALARDYFDHDSSLIAFAGDSDCVIWSATDAGVLRPNGVPREIFFEVMAMKTATKALSQDAKNSAAVALYVAANLRRENNLPAGANDSVYGDNRFSPAFYATLFGSQLCQDVLALGLDTLDTPLVLDAIGALQETTGGSNLFNPAGGRQPLLEAMRYPDRRVQYETAFVLGRALPKNAFPGDFAVVPALASAVRAGDASYAVVIADAGEETQTLVGGLEAPQVDDMGNVVAPGFTVVAVGPSVQDVIADITNAVGVDLVVVKKSTPASIRGVIRELRIMPRTSNAPVVVSASEFDFAELKQAFSSDVRVTIVRRIFQDNNFALGINEAVARAGGRITTDDAQDYAMEAISVLRDIAISGNAVYDIADAEIAMIEALQAGATGGAGNIFAFDDIRGGVAETLAMIDTDRAQQTLFNAALASEGIEQIDLLHFVTQSIKRNGDRSQDYQIEGLLTLVQNSQGVAAEAAARAFGALNRASPASIQFIIGDQSVRTSSRH